ncbi:hypothetical protein EXT68_02755 [Pectobacterium parmentieri]|uniref:Fimbrial protein n=1 Tax=Pectobacterium parmentieri TaxID=1905730 RepID=A0A0H3I0P8_PECPM|nr:hypothetical protein [Pectobacterium parmentieri]AFI89637.1 Hypothetical protein W5S_1545 [Pectobacterium parmentieri]MBI0472062.1 hypothetical protein [Pectobacterium parmentieri]MBI0495171.1 hypothetical protein [Pectobacterium parmentieri]MBI0556223.1 hypothetical protein [Pectobacterium parmentieri]MBI0569307.1 hypothetical protein [Pectobacterium parmentieri]
MKLTLTNNNIDKHHCLAILCQIMILLFSITSFNQAVANSFTNHKSEHIEYSVSKFGYVWPLYSTKTQGILDISKPVPIIVNAPEGCSVSGDFDIYTANGPNTVGQYKTPVMFTNIPSDGTINISITGLGKHLKNLALRKVKVQCLSDREAMLSGPITLIVGETEMPVLKEMSEAKKIKKVAYDVDVKKNVTFTTRPGERIRQPIFVKRAGKVEVSGGPITILKTSSGATATATWEGGDIIFKADSPGQYHGTATLIFSAD